MAYGARTAPARSPSIFQVPELLAARTENVTHAHDGDRVALDAVSFSVQAGECVAIIGPSGAGKTTLLQILATALRQSSGALTLLGEDPWSLGAGARRRLRRRIGMVHQSPPLPPRQRVVTAVLADRKSVV